MDGDACPVKAEVIKVATRHRLRVWLVATEWLRIGQDNPLVHAQVVSAGWDAVDDWIVDAVTDKDLVITGDIRLAQRCLEKDAGVLAPNGKMFTQANIGQALAMRDLKAHLRETGEGGQFNPSFTSKDRSRFLDQLEQCLRKRRA